MDKHDNAESPGVSRKHLARSENALHELREELNDLRTRLATLEAWILDKENTGALVRVYIQSVNTGKYLDSEKKWVADRAQAFSFNTTLNSVQYCRANKVKDARLVLELERTSGLALVPVELEN
jgi:hypothetical protein